MGSVRQLYGKEESEFLAGHRLLWRYIPLRTFLFYLTGNIFIPSIASLQHKDPFEGKFNFETRFFNEAMRRRYDSEVDTLERWIHDNLCADWEKKAIAMNKSFPNYEAGIIEQQYSSFLRKTRYAWCWFSADEESAAMWNNYGHQGVAIATTVDRLSKMLGKTDWHFEFGRLRYVRLVVGEIQDFNFDPDNPEDARFLLKPHFLKRIEYKSENEVRFVAAAPERHVSGIGLQGVSPSEWLKEIRLWPGLKPTEEESLKQVVDHFAAGVPCACSDLFGVGSSSQSFTARYFSELDRTGWQKWTDGSDGIPQALKEL
jgi:hypothetical protein